MSTRGLNNFYFIFFSFLNFSSLSHLPLIHIAREAANACRLLPNKYSLQYVNRMCVFFFLFYADIHHLFLCVIFFTMILRFVSLLSNTILAYNYSNALVSPKILNEEKF